MLSNALQLTAIGLEPKRMIQQLIVNQNTNNQIWIRYLPYKRGFVILNKPMCHSASLFFTNFGAHFST